jgi:hypothetical protein
MFQCMLISLIFKCRPINLPMASQLDGLQPQPSQEELIGIFSVYKTTKLLLQIFTISALFETIN